MNRSFARSWLTGTVLSACVLISAGGDEPTRPPQSSDLAINIAASKSIDSSKSQWSIDKQGDAEPKLDHVLQFAHSGLKRLEEVKDYTCTLVRRERSERQADA